MGVTGLLPFLKKVHETVNVSKFAGCTVAIDAYCWLHKGAFSCAEKLALGEKTDQYVYYCMKFINNLLAKNIKPVMVFDGCHLPSKKNVEKSRREKRDQNRKKAAQFLREGRRAEARECLQRCIDISPEMALELMNACRSKGVDCIVAPYEADAQLAYLNKIGVAQVIITEDSDLLLFGCERVLFKMDHAGNGVLIERSRLNEVMELQGGHYTFDKFRYMCILSGCDYLASLNGIGLARANKVFKVARQSDLTQLLKKLSTYLKSNITVPQEYIDGFIQANNTFLYQMVFDPLQRKLVPLNPYSSDVSQEDVTYAGPCINAKKAYQLALGNINIYTDEVFADFDPDTFVPKYVKKKPESCHLLSIWDKNYRIRPKPGLTEVQPCDRPVMNGKEITVKANFRKISPKKRLREADDSIDVKSNTELSNLYVQSSPAKKKLKTEDINDDLHRFMFSAEQENFEEDTDITVDKEEHNDDGPEFFSSLTEAQPGTSNAENLEHVDDDKENGIKSPSKNVFAFKSPSKKPRFNLNATKPPEVKSRFFAKSIRQIKLSKSLKTASVLSTSSCKKEETPGDCLKGYTLVHENNANVSSTKTSSDPNSECDRVTLINDRQCISDLNKSPDQSIKVKDTTKTISKSSAFIHKAVDTKPYVQSPTSAFNWSKFKFASKDGATTNDKISASPKLSTAFSFNKKKVDSNFISNKETVISETYKNSSIESSSSQCDSDDKQATEGVMADNTSTSAEEVVKAVECSLGSSYPYSIDSDCLPSLSQISSMDTQSQQSSVSEDSQSSINTKSSIQSRKKGLSIYFKPTPESSKTGQTNIVQQREKDTTKEGQADSVLQSATDKANTEVVLIVSDDEESVKMCNSTSNKIQRPIAKKSPRSSKGKTKTGCRVSGLSKRSKTVTLEDSSKQQSLKDMFSKFAHAKSIKPQLSHEGEVNCTPESENSLLDKDIGQTQRLLQL